MIEFRLGSTDLCRTRFAYSPLSELAAGLHALATGAVHPLHRPWLSGSRKTLGGYDVAVLRAVVPPKPQLAEFLYGSLAGRSTTIDEQLDGVAAMSADAVRADLTRVWEPTPLPRLLEDLLTAGPTGVRRIVDALRACWSATIEPHWPRLRSVLDADVAFRADRLTHGGSEALLADLHPQVRLVGDAVQIDKARYDHHRNLTGQGLVLVPSILTWPRVIVAGEEPNQPALVYAARGIASVWEDDGAASDDPLAALIGRTRAAILRSLDVPHSPTQLAALLHQSPSSASQHLTVLRRSGLASGHRKGRHMLYARTPLAEALMAGMADAADQTA